MSSIIILLGVAFLSGAAGGLAGSLLESMNAQPDEELEKRRTTTKYIIIGIVAAFAVPLFLSVAQSKLLDDILSNTNNDSKFYSSLLIYCGFCIVAGFSARAFLTNLSQRVLQQIESNRQRAENAERHALDAKSQAIDAKSEALDAHNKAEVAVDLAEEAAGSKPVTEVAARAMIADAPDERPPQLSEIERSALRALVRVTFLTQTGLAREIGVPRNEIGLLVDALVDKGVIEKTVSPNTGGPRWRITPLGVRALSAE
ncbi:MAG TPA: YEATS-associated helix-containing protein [Beijerinckiaceae bacterium]|jgi:uncharacterized membrane protein